MSKRDEQRDATRARIVDAAVESLVETGAAETTTLAVQRRAGVSRGALLHHFPTREELFGAAVSQLVARNELAVRRELTEAAPEGDPLLRSLRVLRTVMCSPSFAAEMELWAVARTNPRLREVLRHAEGAARRDLYRVVDEVMGPELTASAAHPMVAELTVHLLRGMAISDVLHREDSHREALLERWAQIVRPLLT
ncbi:TetR/AcrR family transcriptional regulator [Streptomyces sp. SP18BB07]|uniref:TetR/AcrR family transcriptional regulator n=1 Tax=Streptomyces sp. SP18BB07 TaxID=3002522 RepID=UPI002E79206F|nr:TetR/AcrR family transcriptional regulator [Streptomyces sp. SP18BB07]MEE1757812.1 TetR/AcrR family transcriptional regulator [Streptomyces sp. SP18BB07]